MVDEQKSLTPTQRSDKLWSKLKRKAEEIGFGRLTIEVIVHQGQITQIEVRRASEIIRAD